MLRIERDAAEDQYYSLKKKHDEAVWKIEDLESQLKSIQEDSGTSAASHEQLEFLDDSIDDNVQSFRDQTSVPSLNASFQSDPNTESEVAYVDIDSQFTGGFDSHGKSGDDGLVVALKPTDENGTFVPVAAPVTISLIDPARKGIRQRVGLWKFSAQQVAGRFDRKNSVFMFRLPWQRESPINSNLKLFVRFQADDGKRESEMDVQVVLDGQPKSRWTQVPKPENAIDLSPRSVQADASSSTHPANSAAKSESPIQIARPEWSPIR